MADQDPQTQTPQNVEVAGEIGGSDMGAGGDQGPAGVASEATTVDAGVAIDGGKLPGNHDDFDGELDDGPHAVPGADKKHHPAHAMNKGETKHLGV